MNEFILVMTTVPDREVGQILAEKIIEDRLAACVTQFAPVQSLYRWEGKISQDQEYVLFIKTKTVLFAQLESKILQIHPYKVPEIIAVPILTGHKSYLDWMDKETQT